jgi:hypothetical protein
MATSIQEAGIPRAGSNLRDEPGTLLGRGATTTTTTTASNACVFPPICLAVGSIAVSSELPYLLLPRGRGAAAPNDDEPQSLKFHYSEVGGEDDEPRPGYAFVDSDDDENCDEAPRGGHCMDRFEFDLDCTFMAQGVDRGHGPGKGDFNDDNASHRTGSSGESDGTDASGSTHIHDDDGNNTPIGGTTTSPNTHQLLVELMVRMRESRVLAQQLQDHQSMSERMAQRSSSPVGTQPAPAPRTIPASRALQPRCASRLGRSATARLYPNVVASLGCDMSRDRTNQPRCVGLLKADTLTDSEEEEEDDDDNDNEVDELRGRGTRCRFEIWRVHALHDGANGGELCFQMWKARADWRSRQVQRNKEHHLEGRMIGQGTRLLDPSLCADHEDDLKYCAGNPASVRSDARMTTSQVPIVCDWIRKLRSDSGDRRIMILSTAEDAAARSHPSYQVVSNLILNPDGSKPEPVHLLANKSEAAPIEPVPTSSGSYAMRKLWPTSKPGLDTADALAGKRVLAAGAPPHVGLSTAPLERSQQLALDRLRCWKRRRPGCVVEASTDASSSATVASF